MRAWRSDSPFVGVNGQEGRSGSYASLIESQEHGHYRFDGMTSDCQTRQDFPEGFHLGPFEIRNRLASGTWGDVYKARYRVLNRDVAVRIVRPAAAGRWDQETAKTSCRLRHPNVVSVHFAGLGDDHIIVAMDYMEGRTLKDILCEDARPGFAETLRICSSVAMALEKAHTLTIDGLPSPLPHLGLRPSKIFLEPDGTVLVSGFGFVEAIGPEDPRTAGAMSSFPYMAPEQFSGTPSYQSDQWAVGILLFEMLLRKTPYHAESREGYRTRISEREMETIPEFEQVPAPLRSIILRCLQRDPANRYESTHTLVTALATVGAALGLPKCPVCGADLPPGSEACFECTLVALRESYGQQRGHSGRRVRKDHVTGGSRSFRVGVIFAAIVVLFGGYVFWQNWQRRPLQGQDAAEPSPFASALPSPVIVREVPGNLGAAMNRNPSGDILHTSPAAAAEWENVLAQESSRTGSYEERIARLSKFIGLFPGTAQSIQAEERLRNWEAENQAFRIAEDFERSPDSRFCAILAKWQDFDARQKTGLRHAYALGRIEYWRQQVQDYIGYADLMVRSAVGLPLADTNLFGSGRPDPYFELLEGSNVIYRSRVLDENSSPRWNEKARIYIWKGLVLNLEIWDYNPVGRDLILHQTLLPLPVDGPYQIRNGNIVINLEIERER